MNWIWGPSTVFVLALLCERVAKLGAAAAASAAAAAAALHLQQLQLAKKATAQPQDWPRAFMGQRLGSPSGRTKRLPAQLQRTGRGIRHHHGNESYGLCQARAPLGGVCSHCACINYYY